MAVGLLSAEDRLSEASVAAAPNIAPQHRLYFSPLPQGQGSFRPGRAGFPGTLGGENLIVALLLGEAPVVAVQPTGFILEMAITA